MKKVSKKTIVKPATKTTKKVIKENDLEKEKAITILKEMKSAYRYVLTTKGWERQLDDRLQAVKYALSVLEK